MRSCNKKGMRSYSPQRQQDPQTRLQTPDPREAVAPRQPDPVPQPPIALCQVDEVLHSAPVQPLQTVT